MFHVSWLHPEPDAAVELHNLQLSDCFERLNKHGLRYKYQSSFPTYQQSHVINRETFQNIGETWLQINALLIEDKDTQQVPWNVTRQLLILSLPFLSNFTFHWREGNDIVLFNKCTENVIFEDVFWSINSKWETFTMQIQINDIHLKSNKKSHRKDDRLQTIGEDLQLIFRGEGKEELYYFLLIKERFY